MKDEEINEIKIQKDIAFINWNQGFEAGKSQTIQQVRDVLETKLNYWNNLLKNKSNHSLSDEIDIQQMRAKVEIIEELLSQLEEIKGEVKHG